MNLHNDRAAFEEIITAASTELRISKNIIEKDYYVTLALRELSNRIPDMVFKGGTSLTKCYQLLDRFSEDIDLSFNASIGHPSEKQKRQLKEYVITSLDTIGLPIANFDQIYSRRNYNRYHFSYTSLFSTLSSIHPELIIETFIFLLPFPTLFKPADNYIHRFLKDTAQESLAEKYDLMPFLIRTQTIERTFVDKVFAVCDYFITGKEALHSRHLYDIHKIIERGVQYETLPALINDVRKSRSPLPMCPSAAAGIDINQILSSIIESEAFRKDYETVTQSLLFTPVSYNTVIKSLKTIIENQYFI